MKWLHVYMMCLKLTDWAQLYHPWLADDMGLDGGIQCREKEKKAAISRAAPVIWSWIWLETWKLKSILSPAAADLAIGHPPNSTRFWTLIFFIPRFFSFFQETKRRVSAAGCDRYRTSQRRPSHCPRHLVTIKTTEKLTHDLWSKQLLVTGHYWDLERKK